MSNFNNYSKYYNLLYQDKNYEEETDYINSLIQTFAPNAKNILELGCGTGKHASLLTKKGYSVHGVDRSETMVSQAKELEGQNITFEKGDVRNYSSDKKFDSIISLFHVASYLTNNEDLINYFKTMRKHLKPEGICVFDCWYGPAVLSDKPVNRIKELENEEIKVKRTAIPDLYPDKNIVDVNYTLEIFNKITKKTEIIKETHSMRYLFSPEIELLLDLAGFEVIHSEEWMSKKVPSSNTWNVCFVGKLK